MNNIDSLGGVWKRQQGLSLVELMVSLVVGLILIYGVSEIYVNSKGTYNTNEEMSRMQENARFAFDLMVPRLRLAGYTGCVAINSKTYNPAIPNDIRKGISGTSDEFYGATAVKGNEFSGTVSTPAWSPALSGGLTGSTIHANTDAVTVQSVEECGGQLVQVHLTTTAQVQIDSSNTCGFAPGDSIMISDCSNWTLFKATSVGSGSKINIAHGSNMNTKPHFPVVYKEDAELLKFQSFTFYIGDGTSGLPALRRIDNSSGNDDELVEGVESMQILYGIDTDTADGIVNRYVKADAIPVSGNDWDKVSAVRISLLMRSIKEVTTTSGSTNFDGVSYGPDRFLRQQYTATIQLRNRSLLP